jgi:colanic acid/amylovoran biosynthesis glycosyltransferase
MNTDRPTICIVRPKPAYSDTFIRAHVERLPANLRVLYPGPSAYYREDDGSLTPPLAFWRHLKQWIALRIYKLSREDLQTAALTRFLANNRVAAVLAEYGTTGVALMQACERAAIPLIVHFFGFDAYSRETLEGVGRRYPELFDVASAIVVVSRHMEEQLLRLGAPGHKVFYNPCGADVTRFHGANPAQSPPRFVAIGRFVDKKAPFLTLLAFEQVLAAVPEARLTMVGDGYLWEASQQLATALGIAGRVEFLGPRPHAELTSIMQEARAFVQHSVTTSYGDSEGTPVIVLEAAAMGLPVVSTRHGGIPDVVIDGESGLLVDEGDVEAMAECMIRLLEDPLLAARLGQAARERVETEFAQERTIDHLWHIIETSIDAYARGREENR